MSAWDIIAQENGLTSDTCDASELARNTWGREFSVADIIGTSGCETVVSSSLRVESLGPSIDVRDFPDVVVSKQDHEHSCEAKAEAAVGRTSIFEKVQVEPERL